MWVLVGALTIAGVVGFLAVDMSGLEDLLGVVSGLWNILVDGLSFGVEDSSLDVSVLDFGDGSWDLSSLGLGDSSELGLGLSSEVGLLLISELGLGDSSVFLDWDLSDSLLSLGFVGDVWDLSSLLDSLGFLDFLGDILVLNVLFVSIEGLGSLLGDLSWDLAGSGLFDDVVDGLWDFSDVEVVLGLDVNLWNLSGLLFGDSPGGWGGDGLVEGGWNLSGLELLLGGEDISWDLLLVGEAPGVGDLSWDISVASVLDGVIDGSWLLSGAGSLLSSEVNRADSLGLRADSWLVGGVWNLNFFDGADVLGVLVVILMRLPFKFDGGGGGGQKCGAEVFHSFGV